MADLPQRIAALEAEIAALKLKVQAYRQHLATGIKP
jgi:uncharacterized small protein (DUF1192 family)